MMSAGQLRSPLASTGSAWRSLLLTATVAVGMLAAPVARGQQAPVSYTLVADASGVTMSVTAPALTVVDTLFELGGSVAQSEVNSLGISRAFAANPTPGELVLTTPGLLAGLSGLPIPNEQFPTTVQSSHPSQPEQTSGVPPSQLEARSDAQSSEALALFGVAGGGNTVSTARSFVDDDGRSVAEADVSAGPIVVGPVVIADVTSQARSVVDEQGEPTASATMEVGAVVVDGQGAVITPDGLALAGNEVPLAGATTPDELVEQGIEVRLLEGDVDAGEGAATSPSIEIRVRQVLDEGIPGVVPAGQEVIVRWIVGRSTVSASAVVLAPATPRVPDLIDEPALSSGTAPSSTVRPPPPATVPAPRATGQAQPPQTDGAGEPVASPELRLVTTPIDSFLFYPVLVVATITALVAMHTVRTSGRRRLWRLVERHPVKEIPDA